MITKLLKRCPFCNGEAEIKEGIILAHKAYAVKCKKCSATTAYEILGTVPRGKQMQSIYLSDSDAIAKVVKLWNNRTRAISAL